MSQSKLIKLSPWAFMLASLTFLTMIPPIGKLDIVAIPSSAIGTILLVVGLLGLRARYRDHISHFGKSILLAGVIASLIPILTLGISAVIYAFYRDAVIMKTMATSMESGWWLMLFVGPALSLLALLLFGLDAIRSKPMAGYNWLPIAAGFWYPAYIILVAIFLITRRGDYPEEYQASFNFLQIFQFVTLVALGFVLFLDKVQEVTATPIEPSARQGSLIGK